jgi:chromosome segregation ATPase
VGNFMAIASVMQGLIETENGKVFELDSPKGVKWVESITSFRYEPAGANKPYTVRQETKKGGDYWYGYRKVAGKLHKKYIGKSSELSTVRLEEIAEALNTPQQPRVTQVVDTVTQVTEANNQQVADAVTDSHTAERVTALELQMQALRESLEALRSELLGKPEGLSNFSELPNPYQVTDSELQIELSNLKTELSNLATENEKLRADYAALLESSTAEPHDTTGSIDSEVEVNVTSSPDTSDSSDERFAHALVTPEEALADAHFRINMLQANYDELEDRYEATRREIAELRSQLETERADREEIESKLSDLKQKSATADKNLPEAANLLNQLKAKRKKSKADLTDLEVILDILES